MGVDAAQAAREYRLAGRTIAEWTNPGQPLAIATNNGVWKAMLSPTLIWSNLPQNQNLRALNLLIRFYISIEDGESPVERDLAALCAFNDAHVQVDRDVADDSLLLRSDPVEVDDICPDSPSRLGSKSQPLATRAKVKTMGNIVARSFRGPPRLLLPSF